MQAAGTLVSIITANPVAWLALVVSLVAVCLTYWRSRRDFRRQSSQDYLGAATGLLETAFKEFDDARDSNWNGLPRPDRLLWLTVARTLIESEQTADKIREASHRALYQLSKDFWRGKFADLLRPLGAVRLTYFAETADAIVATVGGGRMSISPKSLRVILDFSEWPKGKPDPISAAAQFTDREIDEIRTFRYRAVGDYLDATDAMLRGEESRRTHWRKEWKTVAKPGDTVDID